MDRTEDFQNRNKNRQGIREETKTREGIKGYVEGHQVSVTGVTGCYG
jgi:hypothetical protein